MDKVNLGGFAADNEIIFAKKAEKICVPVCEKTVVTELSDDFTLPDYRPEIRRLLRISVSLPAPSAYISDSSAEFSGDAVYSVLYVGGDGKLCSAELTAVYEAATELSGGESFEGISAFDELCAENIVGRVTAPRKLNIRCRVRHLIRALGERALEVSLESAPSEENVKKLTETYPTAVTVRADDDSYELEESIPISEDARVITALAVPFINDAQVRDGGAAVRGSISLSLLYDTEAADPVLTERKIPFEAVIPIEADGDGWDCRAWGCSAGITTQLRDSSAVCRIRLSLSAEAQKNLPTQITKDIYATDRPCKLDCEDLRTSVGQYCGVGNFTVSGSAELSGLLEEYDIVSSSATAEAGELLRENGKYVLTGKCRFSALLFGAGEYSAREFELPFRYEFGNADGDADDYSADLSCHAVRVRGDKNTLVADAELSCAVRVWSEQSLVCAVSASFGEAENTGSRPAYTVVYVSEGESLWELAKKHSADPDAIARSNGLKITAPASPDSLSGVDFLII